MKNKDLKMNCCNKNHLLKIFKKNLNNLNNRLIKNNMQNKLRNKCKKLKNKIKNFHKK